MNRQIDFILRNADQFGEGILLTLQAAGISMVMALIWGLFVVFPRMSHNPWVRWPTRTYIELFRNTPLLLQIYLFYFSLPLIGLPLSALSSGALAIAVQHGAFFAEIYRGAIESIPQGQRKAALSIGMLPNQAMRLIIIPQALRRALPPMGNQLILLIKDTSLLSAIGVLELTLTGKVLIERSAASYEVFIAIACMYLVITSILGTAIRFLEHRIHAKVD
ncbi:MAG: amino acid ABC transporter permease [Rhodovibrionaceae bacterium]